MGAFGCWDLISKLLRDLRFVFACVAVVLTGCGQSVKEREAPMTNALLYDSEQVAKASHLVIFVPGVFSRIQIFDAAASHLPAIAAPAYYRFPGLDGLPVTPGLQIEQAASDIAALAESYPEHELTLVGYSGGAAIVLEASQLLKNGRVANVALISPTPPFGGGLATRLRTTRDILSVASRIGSLNVGEIWPEYWKILAFGRENYRSGARRDETAHLLEQERGNIVLPKGAIVAAHSTSLRKWDLSEEFDADNLRIGVFYGAVDPVFSEAQTSALIRRLGTITRTERYPDQGHILMVTEPRLFSDVFGFAQ